MLPVIAIPTYEVKLHSLPQPIKYRPYLVKEEKVLLMAQSSDDPKDMETAIREVIRACTDGKIDVLRLPTFDLEMMFLHLRARSVNNIINVRFECQKAISTETETEAEVTKCGAIVPCDVNIDDIGITVPEGHTTKVWLNDAVGVVMKYPTAEQIDALAGAETEPEKLILVIAQCIAQIFTKEGEVHETSETPLESVRAFVESLTIPQVHQIREQFFDTLPYVSHTIKFACPKCGHAEDIVLRGIADFFG